MFLFVCYITVLKRKDKTDSRALQDLDSNDKMQEAETEAAETGRRKPQLIPQ